MSCIRDLVALGGEQCTSTNYCQFERIEKSSSQRPSKIIIEILEVDQNVRFFILNKPSFLLS